MASGNGTACRRGVILAAGGLLWNKNNNERKLALVKHPKSRDWRLPKGKHSPKDKSLKETAIREVREETGCDVILKDFADKTQYRIKSGTKQVLYWHMELKEEDAYPLEKDVEQVRWFPVRKALQKLKHRKEKEIVRKNLGWRK